MKIKAHKLGKNTVGTRFAVVPKNGAFSVWKECQNYASHVRGGLSTSWRVCASGLSVEAAEAMYNKKIAGRAR
jgi:hypothetical protein